MAKNTRRSNWLPPENYAEFFGWASDEAFKARHPVGYVLLVMLGLAALFLPSVVYVALMAGTGSMWMLLGLAGSLVFGVGLFNLVAMIIRQYLGHWVTLIAFLCGGAMMLTAWFLCG